MLEILSIIRKAPVNKIPDLQQEKIYDINNSPNIQGVKAKDDNTLSPQKDWKWCLDGSSIESKGYHELIVPSLGYYFGGSRYDTAYKDKEFKQQDCSSWLAKLLELSDASFTTHSLLNKTEGVLSVLKPLGDDRPPIKGDVFAFQDHCGVVAGYSDSETPIDVLSYTRAMPFFEGLIYQQYPQVNNGKKVIKADWRALSELSIEKYYGLDNQLGNLDQPKVSGDIQYFDEI